MESATDQRVGATTGEDISTVKPARSGASAAQTKGTVAGEGAKGGNGEGVVEVKGEVVGPFESFDKWFRRAFGDWSLIGK
ncbi:hypothetical protein Tdes44962_MAKER07372 [Teratosphaeria destructans]|uniref:Uncharacterized protein n=1 Tax=Teratosphaeria destructans TaxID=418781 RepID=A0A9W7W697_9PEZI|nr:hypothetical protein Tdes44962_MAKER07372 [Teratosphaeria destructans]